MLSVEGAGKRYGRRRALEDVSFTARRGEVIALLGRNGAGKSTLMNIVTGYIAQTEGEVRVAGRSVLEEPLIARRHIGYLPEQPPLYPDMTVAEYLHYCAELKGVPKEGRKAEIARVMAGTALEAYARRLNRQLSKGYRQRLGVAQALLGSPDLLVLDEPGSGLDPLQMVQMREVIRAAGRGSTVLLSSHMLTEVTSVCQRAVVLERGRVCYDGPMQALMESAGCLRVRYRGGEEVARALAALPGATELRRVPLTEEGAREVEIFHGAERDLRALAAEAVRKGGGALLEIAPRQGSLEDAFLRLMNREEDRP